MRSTILWRNLLVRLVVAFDTGQTAALHPVIQKTVNFFSLVYRMWQACFVLWYGALVQHVGVHADGRLRRRSFCKTEDTAVDQISADKLDTN